MIKILAAGLCILSLSTVSAQYEADDVYARLTEFPPVIMGHRHRDLHTTETRPSRYVERPSKLKRIKQKPLREDFESDENDDKEYTVSAHFQVNHPSPYSLQKSKKERPSSLFDPSQKSYSYANLHIATEKKYKESSTRPSKSKPHKKPIFKPVRPEFQSDLEIPSLKLSNVDPEHYEVSGIDQDPRSFKPNFQLQDVPNLYPREKQYRNVASKGQFDKYMEDQQKMLDEAIELQLLNDPNPISKGKYQQFLKAKDDERIEKEYEEEIRKPRPTYRPQFPRKSKSEAKKPIKKAPSPGLGHYRTPKGHGSYRFTLDI